FFFTGLHARYSGFEFGKHTALTQHKREVFRLAAGELFTIDTTHEIKRNAVVLRSGTAFARLVRGTLLTQDFDGALDVGIGDFAIAASDGQLAKVGDFDVWIDLERRGERQGAFFGPFGLGFELRGTGDTQVCFAQNFL